MFCINCFEIQSVREIQLSREVTQAALFKQANNIESAAFVHHNFKGIVFYLHTTYGNWETNVEYTLVGFFYFIILTQNSNSDIIFVILGAL